ncbi:MAG: chitobiase/beta-hexosaminidase C-terminal domain-containing protein [Firmicutes bacterium]|nr:chitobiase/beta-hexosaminidase C-terminal domain-containing protein [Bacillota bacterium]
MKNKAISLIMALIFVSAVIPTGTYAIGDTVLADYENKSIGDILYRVSNYNVTVAADPEEPLNKVSMQVFSQNTPSGYMPDINFSPAATGEILITERVRFEGTVFNMQYLMNARTKANNALVNLWTVNNTADGGIKNNVWYTLELSVVVESGRYEFRVIDKKQNLVVKSNSGTFGGAGADFSQGLSHMSVRYIGSVPSGGSGRIYRDDLALLRKGLYHIADDALCQAEVSRNRAEVFKAEELIKAVNADERAGLTERLNLLKAQMQSFLMREDYSDFELGELIYEGDGVAAIASKREDFAPSPAAETVFSGGVERQLTIPLPVSDIIGFQFMLSNPTEMLSLRLETARNDEIGEVVTEICKGSGVSMEKPGAVYIPENKKWLSARIYREDSSLNIRIYDKEKKKTVFAKSVELFDWEGIASFNLVLSGKGGGNIVSSVWLDNLSATAFCDTELAELFLEEYENRHAFSFYNAEQSINTLANGTLKEHFLDRLSVAKGETLISRAEKSLSAEAILAAWEYMPNISYEIDKTVYINKINAAEELLQAPCLLAFENWQQLNDGDDIPAKRSAVGLKAAAEHEDNIVLHSYSGENAEIEFPFRTTEYHMVVEFRYKAEAGATIELEARSQGAGYRLLSCGHSAVSTPASPASGSISVDANQWVRIILAVETNGAYSIFANDGTPKKINKIQMPGLPMTFDSIQLTFKGETGMDDLTVLEVSRFTAPSTNTEQSTSVAERNSDNSLTALCNSFFEHIDFDRPEFEYVRYLYSNGEKEDALREYYTFFTEKLLELDNLDWSDFIFNAASPMAKALAVNLYFGVAGSKMDGAVNSAYIGKPGEVAWTSYGGAAYEYMRHFVQFTRMLNTYEGEYGMGERFGEYASDWSMNQNLLFDRLPADIPDEGRGHPDLLYYFKLMRTNLKSGGAFSDVPPFDAIRVLNTMVDEYMPRAAIYFDSNPQNWTNGGYEAIALTGMILKRLGFTCGDYLGKKGIERLKAYMTYSNLSDGADQEQNLHYNHEFLDYAPKLLEKIELLEPELLEPEVKTLLKYQFGERISFLTRMLQINGTFPSGCRIDMRDWRSNVLKYARMSLPEALLQPDTAAVLNATSANPDGSVPSFTSSGYPWGGFFMMRNNWEKDNQEGLLFCSPKPGNYTVRTTSGSNVFTLRGFGQDLIVAGEVGNYDTIKSPVLVDGSLQAMYNDIYYWNHRNAMTVAWQEPADWPWHTSSSFDLASGVYARNFSGGIRGVVHTRYAIFLKEVGVWVLTDRLNSPVQHTYTRQLRLPSLPIGSNTPKNYKAFTNANIIVNAQNNNVKTNDAGIANLSIYNFSSAPIADSKTVENINASNSYKVSNFTRLDTKATFTNGVISSLIVPRADVGGDVGNIQSLETGTGGTGFKAQLDCGGNVFSVSSSTLEPVEMTAGAVGLSAVQAVAYQSVTGKISGVVLGCSYFKINGEPKQPPGENFEFGHEGGALTFKKINTPVHNVKILPEQATFIESVDIELACETSGVEIRYTTDGTEPSQHSPLYTAPFTINSTTYIRAKAFRNDGTADGFTAHSPISQATFEKSAPLPAQNQIGLVQGLFYRRTENEWKRSYLGLIPQTGANGATGELFGSECDRGGTFTLYYDGYLDIGQTGVYSFYAPSELIETNIMAGYNLHLRIDGVEWNPSRLQHAPRIWSVPLEKGYHRIEVIYSDFRADSPERYNTNPNKKDIIWREAAPQLEFSGPGVPKGAIPAEMLKRPAVKINTPHIYNTGGINITSAGLGGSNKSLSVCVTAVGQDPARVKPYCAIYDENKSLISVVQMESGQGCYEAALNIPEGHTAASLMLFLWDENLTPIAGRAPIFDENGLH